MLREDLLRQVVAARLRAALIEYLLVVDHNDIDGMTVELAAQSLDFDIDVAFYRRGQLVRGNNL